MTTPASIIVPAATGFVGVVCGAFLGPIAIRYFARRDRTLLIRVFDKNPPTLISPHQDIVITWSGDPIDRLLQIGFEATNKSKIKLRNFTLEIEAGDLPHREDQTFDISLPEDPRARWTELECSRKTDDGRDKAAIYRFEFIEAKASIQGTIITNGSSVVRFLSNDDLELDVRYDSMDGSSGLWKFIAGAATAASAAALGALLQIAAT